MKQPTNPVDLQPIANIPRTFWINLTSPDGEAIRLPLDETHITSIRRTGDVTHVSFFSSPDERFGPVVRTSNDHIGRVELVKESPDAVIAAIEAAKARQRKAKQDLQHNARIAQHRLNEALSQQRPPKPKTTLGDYAPKSFARLTGAPVVPLTPEAGDFGYSVCENVDLSDLDLDVPGHLDFVR